MAFPEGWTPEFVDSEFVFVASSPVMEPDAFGEVYIAGYTPPPPPTEALVDYHAFGFTVIPAPVPEPECVPVLCDCLPGGAAVALEGALCDCLPGDAPVMLGRNLALHQSCPVSALMWDGDYREWDRGSSCWGAGEEPE